MFAVGLIAPAAAQTSFEGKTFEGKTIRLAVNFAAGGPVDLLARQFAPFIAKHTPGRPTVIIENRTGAGGITGANYIFNATKPDGLTIGYLVGITTPGLIGGDNIRYDPAKFRWLGAVSNSQLLLGRNDLKLATPRDLLTPAQPLVLASNGASATATIANRLFLNMIGAPYKVVSGFRGQADSILALTRGEVSLDTLGLTAYLTSRDTIRQDNIYHAVAQRGELNPDGTFRRNRLIPDIPTMIEAIQEIAPDKLKSVAFATNATIVGAFAVHIGFVLPPGADDALVATLRKAIADALDDPEARALLADKLKTEYDFIDGASCERIVARLREDFHGDPRIAQEIERVIAER
jgi:tripartite-type tricarboxylate transporter receptor subunit TctC